MNLFKLLFETFDTLSAKDITNDGTIAGQKSVYSNTASKGSLQRAINNIQENEKDFSNLLKRKRDIEFQTAINTLKNSNKDSFDLYADRLTTQLEQNGIYDWDKSILRALVELVTFCYLSSTKEEPKVYGDLQRAKEVTQIIFNKLVKKLGIVFPTTNIKDQLQIAVLSTLYDINSKEKPNEK